MLPGPGFVLVVAGRAVLAARFSWAEKPLDHAEVKAQQGVEQVAKSPWRAPERCWPRRLLVALGALALAGVDVPFTDVLPPSCSSCPGSS